MKTPPDKRVQPELNFNPEPPTRLTPAMLERLKQRRNSNRLDLLRARGPKFRREPHWQPAKIRRAVLELLSAHRPGEWFGWFALLNALRDLKGVNQNAYQIGAVLEFLERKKRIIKTALYHYPASPAPAKRRRRKSTEEALDLVATPPIDRTIHPGHANGAYRGYEVGYKLHPGPA